MEVQVLLSAPRRCGRHIVRSDFFCKSRFSLILSQLLSESNPLSLGFDSLFYSDWGTLFCQCFPRRCELRIVRDGVCFKTNAVAHSLRRASFPRKAGGFTGAPNIGCISLAPIFYKSQSACTPLLLLSKPDPLSLGSGLVSVLLQSPLRTIQVRMASTICRREL